MAEKRNQKRRNTPHRINVLAAGDDRVIGRLVNITTDGLMFLTAERFRRDAVITLRLPLPTMSRDRTAIDVTGRVIWQAPDANPQYSRVGFRYDNLGAEEGFIIETILQRLHLVG